jgi:tRNA pseudouridine38-40 synthase
VRLKLTVEYDGTPFRGWAAQPGRPTVEAHLRAALAQTFDRYDGLAVAGRTDTGVHALANVVSFDVEGGPPLERIAMALNPRLPHEVSVTSAEAVGPDFHARFDARARSYRYRIHTRRTPSPFELNRSWSYPWPLDDDALTAAAALLVGKHDFRAFTPTGTQHKVFVRTVESARWLRSGDRLEFEITADSFLRHMVRSLVGTMVERGSLDGLLDGAARSEAGVTAPPHGLYLISVTY